MRLIFKLSLFSGAAALLLAACNLPAGTPNAAATLQAVYTAQASTAQAAHAQGQVRSTPAPGLVFPTLAAPSAAAPATPQVVPVQPSQAPSPTRTQITYCNWASFEDDVTIPDGTVITAGTQFTKTWRLKNIGTCSWTTSYQLSFQDGDYMNGNATVNMPKVVNPGQTVDISITLTAPTNAGSYRGYWVLMTRDGKYFGLGRNAADPFFVDIKVNQGLTTVYKFTSNYCDAIWTTAAETLGCPGDLTSSKGYVTRVENVQMENGQFATGQSLLMSPQVTSDGFIQGVFPAFTVQNGDRFRAILNCAYLATGCNAKLQLGYQVGDGTVTNIWKNDEVYDGQYLEVDTDLSALSGKTVKFILSVLANGSPDNDKLVWVNPRIERLSNLVTPTP